MFHRSERLFLRPGFPEDWQAVHTGIASWDIVRNLARAPWPYETDDARQFVACEQDGRAPNFMVTLPGEGLIGCAGLGYEDDSNQVQLGYWIAKPYWGQGYAAEAARGVLEVARTLGHKRIVASHFVDNPASGRVLRKVGFCPTGEIRKLKSRARTTPSDALCYAIDLEGEGEGGFDCDMKRAA